MSLVEGSMLQTYKLGQMPLNQQKNSKVKHHFGGL